MFFLIIVGQPTLFRYICVEPCQMSTLEVRGGQMSSSHIIFFPPLGTQKLSQPPLALVWSTLTLDNRYEREDMKFNFW